MTYDGGVRATVACKTINQSTRASYFVSYAHRDAALLEPIRAALTTAGDSVWHDRSHIHVGDRWWDEIEQAILAADALVLVATEQSLERPVVRAEIEFALRMGKPIHPILCTPSCAILPAWLQRFHSINIAPSPQPEQIFAAIQRGLRLSMPRLENYVMADLKSVATRQIWPPFGEQLLGGHGAARIAQLIADLTVLSQKYPASSTLSLNLGLTHCIAGSWTSGLSLLRSHAEAANTFASWYFLALHLPKARMVSHLTVAEVRRALRAVEHASALARNPLLTLLRAILETAGVNRGHANLRQHLESFANLWRRCPESAQEGLRAYWCLKKSWPTLGPSSRNLALMVTQHGSQS